MYNDYSKYKAVYVQLIFYIKTRLMQTYLKQLSNIVQLVLEYQYSNELFVWSKDHEELNHLKFRK